MFPLRNNFNPTLPTSTISASWLNTVANIFNDIEGVGCRFDKPMGGEGMGWKLIIDSNGGWVSGGDYSTNYGSSIGLDNETEIITLTTRMLLGTWYCTGVFNVVSGYAVGDGSGGWISGIWNSATIKDADGVYHYFTFTGGLVTAYSYL